MEFYFSLAYCCQKKFRSFIRARDQMLIEIVTNSYKLFFFRAGFLDYRNWPSEKKKRNKTKQNKTIHQDLGIGGEKGRRENDANIW